MIRPFDAMLAVLAIVGAIGVYHVKYDAESAAIEKASLQARIDEERATITLLKAEWSVLNQPDRLQVLAERYASQMGLRALGVEQMARLNELPTRRLDFAPSGGGVLDGYAHADSQERVR